MTKRCVNCAFWRKTLFDTGECRRRAPVATDQNRYQSSEHRAEWPITETRDWCGEWQQTTEERDQLGRPTLGEQVDKA